MGQEISSLKFRARDYEQFCERLRQETALLGRWFEDDLFDRSEPQTGFELEGWLIDSHCRVLAVPPSWLSTLGCDAVVSELASFNFEINGSPRAIRGGVLGELAAELEARWHLCEQHAKTAGAAICMIGILPTLVPSELNLANMTPNRRYRALNEQMIRLRSGEPLRVEIEGRDSLDAEHSSVMLEAATTSFQLHRQVGPDDCVRFFNASLISSAPLAAVSANAPLLFGRDLWAETRIPLFEQAVTIGAANERERRATFGSGYLRHSFMECFEENLRCYKPLLPLVRDTPPEDLGHLRLHNGTVWRWNRPLIGVSADGTPHLRIEHRIPPAGPTPMDCIAVAAFYLGLVESLATAEIPPETSLEFKQVQDNFYRAAREGLDATLLWYPGEDAKGVRPWPVRKLLLEHLVPQAAAALKRRGLDSDEVDTYMSLIAGRAETAQTGSQWQRRYRAAHGCSFEELTRAYLIRQQSGEPVHRWSI